MLDLIITFITTYFLKIAIGILAIVFVAYFFGTKIYGSHKGKDDNKIIKG